MLNCKFCNKSCKNNNSLRNHERLCKENPNRQISNLKSHNEKGIAWNKGLTKEDPRVQKYSIKISEALKGRPGRIWTDEQRKNKSEWRKEYHIKNPEAHPNRKLSGNRNRMSYPEKIAFDWLTEQKIGFEHQKKVGKYFPDFVVGKIIIEIDGEYWHNEEQDKIKDLFFENQGYVVIRIKAKENIVKKLKWLFNRQ